MAWHISPNGDINSCVGYNGPKGCKYKNKEVEHFDTYSKAVAAKEARISKRHKENLQEARAELTKEQTLLIPANDSRRYIADSQMRQKYAQLNSDYNLSRYYAPDGAAAEVSAPREGANASPVDMWVRADSLFATRRADIGDPDSGSTIPANRNKADALLKKHRESVQNPHTDIAVLTADEKYPPVKHMQAHQQQYLDRLAAIGEDRYLEYVDAGRESVKVSQNLILSRQTGLIMKRLMTGEAKPDGVPTTVDDEDYQKLLKETPLALWSNPKFMEWAYATGYPMDNGIPGAARDAEHLEEMLNACAGTPDAEGNVLIFNEKFSNIDNTVYNPQDLLKVAPAQIPKKTIAEVIAAQTSPNDLELKEDLKAFRFNDTVGCGYMTITAQNQRRKYADGFYEHYSNPAYHNLGSYQGLNKVRQGDIIRRPSNTDPSRNTYAVVLDATPEGVLYQGFPSYSKYDLPVLADADRALALYKAGARRTETPTGFTAYHGIDTTDGTVDEGWYAW